MPTDTQFKLSRQKRDTASSSAPQTEKKMTEQEVRKQVAVDNLATRNTHLQTRIGEMPSARSLQSGLASDGAASPAGSPPAMLTADLVTSYQEQLDRHWAEAIDYPPYGTAIRRQEVENAMENVLAGQADLGRAEGTLSDDDVARVTQVRTASRSVNDGESRTGPSAYALSLNNPAAPGGKTELSGGLVIIERPVSDGINTLNPDAGSVLLALPGRPIEKFESVSDMNKTLEYRLNDPAHRDGLLQHMPVSAQQQWRDANPIQGLAGHQLLKGMLSYEAIEGNVFKNRVQSQIHHQKQDIAAVAADPTLNGLSADEVTSRFDDAANGMRARNDVEPYLMERDQKLLAQAERTSWPDWRKNASESDQKELARYETVKQSAQEAADWLLEDVESPQVYGRDHTMQYLKDKFGIVADPNEIRIRAQYTTRTGPQERVGTLLEFLREGPRDASRTDATYSVINRNGSGTSLTDVQLNQTLGELDVRKDFSLALETSYQDAEVKDALSDVLDSQIQSDAFRAKMRGDLSQSGYEVVQRLRDPAKTSAGATTQVSMGGLSINLPGKSADQMKDALVFREMDADGQVQRYLLYVPNSPSGKDYYEFTNWNTLSGTIAAWTRTPVGRHYLQDQLAPNNRDHAAYVFQDATRPDTWHLDESGTATWTELSGDSYRAMLDAATEKKSERRVAEAKAGNLSPDWYKNATPAERQQLTSLADRVQANNQALQANLPKKSFDEFAHEKVKGYIDGFSRMKGMRESVDPATVMVDLSDGNPPLPLIDVFKYGYDSSVNFIGSAKFTSTTGQDLSLLNASVPGHDQGAGRRGEFAQHIDGPIRGAYLGENYTKEVENQYLTEGHVLDNRRALYREQIQATMQYDALQAKLKGELTDVEYKSVTEQIEHASRPGAHTPGTRSLHRLTVNGRAVEGVYVFRGVGPVGATRDLLYTPGAPDGRTLRPYDDATFRPGQDVPRSLTEAMANYYYDRAKYSDQRVVATRIEQLTRGEQKPDTLNTLPQVSNLDREYDRKLELALDPVKETTKTRGQVIGEAVWKGVDYAGMVFSIFPPAGVAFGTLMFGKGMHDAYQAYRSGDRASASLHLLSAGAEAIGAAFDVKGGLKAVRTGLKRLHGVRKTLGLQPG
ncbi:hypothetical protein WJ73_34970, partial [Burkholderia ubonensis]